MESSTLLRNDERSSEETAAALKEFFIMANEATTRASKARKGLEASAPILIRAIRTRGGQSEKVASLLWSVWNGDNKTGLCDDLCGLDRQIGEALLALFAARLFMGGDADYMIRHILTSSGEMARRQAA